MGHLRGKLSAKETYGRSAEQLENEPDAWEGLPRWTSAGMLFLTAAWLVFNHGKAGNHWIGVSLWYVLTGALGLCAIGYLIKFKPVIHVTLILIVIVFIMAALNLFFGGGLKFGVVLLIMAFVLARNVAKLIDF